MLLYPKYISANLLIYLLDIFMVSSDVFIKKYLATSHIIDPGNLVWKYFRGYQVSDL